MPENYSKYSMRYTEDNARLNECFKFLRTYIGKERMFDIINAQIHSKHRTRGFEISKGDLLYVTGRSEGHLVEPDKVKITSTSQLFTIYQELKDCFSLELQEQIEEKINRLGTQYMGEIITRSVGKDCANILSNQETYSKYQELKGCFPLELQEQIEEQINQLGIQYLGVVIARLAGKDYAKIFSDKEIHSKIERLGLSIVGEEKKISFMKMYNYNQVIWDKLLENTNIEKLAALISTVNLLKFSVLIESIEDVSLHRLHTLINTTDSSKLSSAIEGCDLRKIWSLVEIANIQQLCTLINEVNSDKLFILLDRDNVLEFSVFLNDTNALTLSNLINEGNNHLSLILLNSTNLGKLAIFLNNLNLSSDFIQSINTYSLQTMIELINKKDVITLAGKINSGKKLTLFR